MSRPKKLSPENMLAGLGLNARILDISENKDKHGKKQIHMFFLLSNLQHLYHFPFSVILSAPQLNHKADIVFLALLHHNR